MGIIIYLTTKTTNTLTQRHKSYVKCIKIRILEYKIQAYKGKHGKRHIDKNKRHKTDKETRHKRQKQKGFLHRI